MSEPIYAQQRRLAREEGMAANWLGATEADCPYPICSDARMERRADWLLGFTQASHLRSPFLASVA